MRTQAETNRAAQARQLQEALVLRLAKGREWATPGIEAALRHLLTGIDGGLEAASPRVRASLRAIADELAGGVEAATPRLHERISRLLPEAAVPAEPPANEPVRKTWLVAAVAAAAITAGVALWQALRPAPEEEAANDTAGVERPARTGQVDINQMS